MILLPAELSSYRPKKDKSFSVTFNTRELTPNEVLDINNLMGSYCYLAIKENEIDNAELEILGELKADLDPGKSPSQRMRNVLYILFNQDGEGYENFKDYYEHKMNVIIEHLKNKIL